MEPKVYLVLLFLVAVLIPRYCAQELDLNVFQQSDYNIKAERVDVVRYNKDMLDISVKTFKYNRTQAVINATLKFKVDVRNHAMAVTQVYKFMSNEYRFFPAHFAVDGCKAVEANVCGMKTGFAKCGNYTGCPMLKGKTYHVCNWYPDQSRFPPYMPNGQYKLEMQVLHNSEELFVIAAYATVFRPIV